MGRWVKNDLNKNIMENIEREIQEAEKGILFENYKDFYAAYVKAGLRPIIRIHGRTIKNGALIDTPSGFVDVVPYKISEHYANLNVYDKDELVTYFPLSQKNISQFRIEIIQK